MHLVGIEIDAALQVADKASSAKRIPQAGDDIEELARPAVAFVVLDMLVEPEVQRRVGI